MFELSLNNLSDQEAGMKQETVYITLQNSKCCIDK